jgi:hypothetical protein
VSGFEQLNYLAGATFKNELASIKQINIGWMEML